MFERFTEQARQAVALAQDEARGLKHNYVGTETILLGLLGVQQGLAARALESLGITAEGVREQIRRIVGANTEITEGQIPFTPRTKKVLELALREALSLGHDYVGTEHVLLGLARENEGIAARILLDCDVDANAIRAEVMRRLSERSGGPRRPRTAPPRRRVGPERPSPPRTRPPAHRTWLQGLDQLEEDVLEAFGRELDLGDLLIVLASVPDTLAARALQELDVDLDALWGVIERLRRQAAREAEEQTAKIHEVRTAKEEALEAQEFDRAATLRDEERELLEQQAEGEPTPSPKALGDIRRRLGIPRSPASER